MNRTKNPTERPAMMKVAAASYIGTLIEYFDFFLFGTAAALIFNKLFFPNLNPLVGTLASFGAFGAAFVSRPLGGIIFGHFGDRIGRKSMLVLSLLVVGLSTGAVGLLPTYTQVGLLAPVLLVFFRLTQGIGIGGEWSGAVLMSIEHAPPRLRAFYSSFPQCGIPAGVLLSTASFYLVEKLPPDQMLSWGWRVPFIGSAALVLLGLYIRMNIEETPAFTQVKQRKQEVRFPVVEVLRTSFRSLLINVCVYASPGVLFYLATVFIIRYGADRGIPRGTMLGAVCTASFVQIFTLPLYAMLADRIGRKRALMLGALITILGAFPAFWLIDTGKPVCVYLALMLLLPVIHSSTLSPLASFLPEQFETRLRYSGSALSYQLGGLIMSAPTPFVAMSLYASTGSSWPIVLYIMMGSLLTLLVVPAGRETYRDAIDDVARHDTDDVGSGSIAASAGIGLHR
ncbi:MFS transporter [Paraburkholderia sp.]|uniref:MFS transporter n=1 Tax=Paraburkholderia sp. TaxID=1926495 RepID=UPI0039E58669